MIVCHVGNGLVARREFQQGLERAALALAQQAFGHAQHAAWVGRNPACQCQCFIQQLLVRHHA